MKGCLTVDVTYGQQHVKTVVQESGPSLMGRNLLQAIIIRKVFAEDLSAKVITLQKKYHTVFFEELGTISPYKATLSVDMIVKPSS